MNINDSINKMDLSQLNILLEKPYEIKFPYAGLGRPRINWQQHGYEGSISLQELALGVFQVYCRADKKSGSLLPIKKYTNKIEQIELALKVVKTARSIELKVKETLEKHSCTGFLGLKIDNYRSFWSEFYMLRNPSNIHIHRFGATLSCWDRHLEWDLEANKNYLNEEKMKKSSKKLFIQNGEF